MLSMYKKKLTKKEQDTLWGLINFPTLNDKGLAKKTRLKLSTITAIRRRLWEKGYYYTVNIPNFYRLGYNLMSIEYCPLNEAVPFENRIKYFKDYIGSDPNAIFSVMSRSNGLIITIASNYAQITENFEDLQTFLTTHSLIEDNGLKRVIFPFQTSTFWSFFDFSPVHRYCYDSKRKVNAREFSSDKEAKVVSLSKKERRVMYGLLKYPEDSDNSIADRFGVSRQAVSNIKKRFLKEDLISTRRIINFQKTGCDLLAFAYTYFGTKASFEQRKEGYELGRSIAPVFIGISSNFENVLLAAIKTYSELDKIKERILSFYKTHLSLAKQPEILLFSIEDLCYQKNPTFHDLLEEILDIE